VPDANGHRVGCEWWAATIVVGDSCRQAEDVAALRTPTVPRAVTVGPVRAGAAIRVIDEDAALLGALDGVLADAARHHLVARWVWIREGAWAPLSGELTTDFDGWLGMLMLDGLLVRQVDVDGMRCCELLGPGDVLRPWDEDGGAMLASSSGWRVLEPTRLALLDANFARRACRWPDVTAELMQRTTQRSRSLSILLALTQARRADVRLRTLFAHLADRWGRVTPHGVVLPLKLTHSVIAQLTGLRRPSVSLSHGELERSGEIVRLSKACWLIAR
jgi:CRP-like cAMP-binding protein